VIAVIKNRRVVLHIAGALLALIVTGFVVSLINDGYWEMAPYPGGETARAVMGERPWIASGIANLVWTFSIPFGVLIFSVLYGPIASFLELKGIERPVVALAFMVPVLGVLTAGIVFAVLEERTGNRPIWFLGSVLVQQVLFIATGWFWFIELFQVFGD
jgi:hypothetical protein